MIRAFVLIFALVIALMFLLGLSSKNTYKLNDMYCTARNTFIFSSLLILETVQAALPETIAVWNGMNEGNHVVFTSELRESSWTIPVIAARTEHKIIATAIGSSSLVNKQEDRESAVRLLTEGLIVVWTEVVGQQWLLMSAERGPNGWSAPQQLTALSGENVAPTIVHDMSGVPWVFWSSNATGNDDIYLSRKIDGAWTATEMVNDTNKFPDMVPRSQLTDNGEVLVQWDTLDTDANLFIKNQRVYLNTNKTARIVGVGEDVINFALPDSAATTSRVNLHYPANKFIQSEFVQSGFPSTPR